jgi:hypothetical protein
MKASASNRAQGRNTVRKRPRSRRPRCRDCPFRAPSGKCVDRTIKSGRCGDWVWYLRGRKQWRRLYVKPRDPRTPGQRSYRARFGAASKKYSHSLTDEQRDAAIALAAKVRSRPRLGQSGRLTGQQYAIRQDYAAQATERPRKAEKRAKGLQTKGILASTSGTQGGITGVPRGYHRRGIGLPSRYGARREACVKVGRASRLPFPRWAVVAGAGGTPALLSGQFGRRHQFAAMSRGGSPGC